MDEMSLVIEPEKCTGCKTCEAVCSLKHAGECNPSRSMVNALRFEKMGSHYYSIPVVCQQCEIPMCREVCPVNAISQDPKTGAYLVNADTCVGCRMCVIACPVGGVTVDPVTNIASKCDLCDGDPLCAKFCLPEAIIFLKKDLVNLAKKREAVQKMSELLSLAVGASSLRR